MTLRRALAVDLGGTRLRAALVDGEGRIAHRISRPTPATEGADAVVAAIAAACRAVLDESGAGGDLPVGLCSPGPIDAARGIALATPTIRGFTDYPLRDAVAEALGLEVTVENDGPCAALGEWIFGAGQGARDFVYLTISTGIGGGLVSEGRLLRGRLGLAGHVGHLPVRPRDGAVCFCGQRGCWEAEASGSALQARARAAGLGSLEAAFEQAQAGRRDALAYFETAADDIAFGLVTLIHLLSPERIVIGGGVANTFEVLAPMLRDRVAARVLPPFRDVAILRSPLGDDPGLLGAAQLALHPEFRAGA